MKLVTAQEMRELEAMADAGGLGYDQMMRNAAHALAQVVVDQLDSIAPRRTEPSILVLIGPGNNGGDGLVAAAELCDLGYLVRVYIWRRSRKDDWPLTLVTDRPIPCVYAQSDPDLMMLEAWCMESAIIVDALLGTGASGPLRGLLPEVLTMVGACVSEQRRHKKSVNGLRSVLPEPEEVSADAAALIPLVIAVDLPTGVDSDTGHAAPEALSADLTISFAHAKRGQLAFPGANHTGKLLVADIGIPAALSESLAVDVAESRLLAADLPPRPRDGHKGSFGKVMVVGGSANYVGAPGLAAKAAYRVGAGLVTLAVAGTIYPILAGIIRESTFLVLPHSTGALVPDAVPLLCQRLARYSALLIGPGLGNEPCTQEMVEALLSGRAQPKSLGFVATTQRKADASTLPPTVIDADGLNALAERDHWWELLPPRCVLTPHPGEMARLLGVSTDSLKENRVSVTIQSASRWGCIVVLKGAYTVVAEPGGRATVIPFANALLATAGTGDVLAGTIAGLLAQGLTAYKAARVGAYLHAWAGERKREELGDRGLLAGDLASELPKAITDLQAGHW